MELGGIDFLGRTDVNSLSTFIQQSLNSINAFIPFVPYIILLKGAFILGKTIHLLDDK